MTSTEILFQEASRADAVTFIDFMNQVAVETDFLVMDDDGFQFTTEEVELIFEKNQESLDQLCLLAMMGEDIIGAVTVRTASPYRVSHIGNVFIAVKKAYWGYGIGRTLLEETKEWARQNGVLARLELTVQVRNERAVHLYQKLGFEIEGLQKWGARTDEGEWLDLYYMGLLVGES